MIDNRHHRPVRRNPDAAGFTLIEVLVALVVLVLVLPPLLHIFTQGLTAANASGRYARATTVAESLLARTGPVIPLVPGQRTGTQAGRYDWTLTIRPFTADKTIDNRGPLALMEVIANVRWSRGPLSRAITLRSLRIAPQGPPEP